MEASRQTSIELSQIAARDRELRPRAARVARRGRAEAVGAEEGTPRVNINWESHRYCVLEASLSHYLMAFQELSNFQNVKCVDQNAVW